MATFMLTASSQVKSANTESDIANHSGKANRKKFAHKNNLIDKERSDWNVEFDVHSRRELLEAHYAKRLENRKKHNRSKDRSWDSLDDFLATFEGKKARKDSKNERWATQSQVTYVGDKDSLGAVWQTFIDAGVPKEDIRAAYSAGYERYIAKHNEAFPTLPIYHSDVHFDEATPHGHDAIVVMGHTPKGMASESFNNALGELYGYQDKKQGKSENMQRYREENDALAYESITGALKELAQERGIDMDFEFIRTGQDSSVSTETYKREKDLDSRQVELDEREMELSGRKAELEERISGIEEREAAVAQQEADLTGREARLKEKEAELAELERKRVAREADLDRRDEKLREFEQDKISQLRSSYNSGMSFTLTTLRDLAGADDKYDALGTARLDVLIRASSYPRVYTDSEGVRGDHPNRKRYNDASKLLKAMERNQAKQAKPGANLKQQTQSATSKEVEM